MGGWNLVVVVVMDRGGCGGGGGSEGRPRSGRGIEGRFFVRTIAPSVNSPAAGAALATTSRDGMPIRFLLPIRIPLFRVVLCLVVVAGIWVITRCIMMVVTSVRMGVLAVVVSPIIQSRALVCVRSMGRVNRAGVPIVVGLVAMVITTSISTFPTTLPFKMRLFMTIGMHAVGVCV